MPVLIAGGPGSAPARLLLREPGGRTAEPLAQAKLHALAGAIMAGGRTDTVGDETSRPAHDAGGDPAGEPAPLVNLPRAGFVPRRHCAVARGHALSGNDALGAARALEAPGRAVDAEDDERARRADPDQQDFGRCFLPVVSTRLRSRA